MKLFHTADWHLGKLVQGVYMTEDQRFVLEQFAAAVEAERPDAVIIAGDLYDRAVPPTEAVKLLDELLARIVVGAGVPVLAVAGNHDSPSRLEFGSSIMKAARLHIAGELTWPIEPVVLNDTYGEVHVYLVPYAEPGKVRLLLGEDDIRTHDDAMGRLAGAIRAGMKAGVRAVLVGHAFVTPGGEPQANTSDSERPLCIGGAEHVSARHMDGFCYTALGHLHQAHTVGSDAVRYAGSPLKYSISEERHRKGYLAVELDAGGLAAVEKRELAARRDMRTVEGLMADIERHPVSDDYVFVRLLDEAPVLSPMERVRAAYPNALHVERASAVAEFGGESLAARGRSGLDARSLFRAFYEDVCGAEPSPETEKLLLDALDDVSGKEEAR